MKLIKYFILNVLLMTSLFSYNSNKIHLTQDEQNWIENNIVTIGTENWKPIVWKNNEKNELNGIIGELLNITINKLGLKTKTVQKNWKDIFNDFKTHKVDILPALYYTNSREKIGDYTQAFFQTKEFLYVKDSNKNIKSFEDMKNKKLAIIKGYAMIKIVKDKFPSINIIETKDLEESIGFVLNGNVNGMMDSQIVVSNYIKINMITGLKPILQKYFQAKYIHMITNNQKPILNTILQKGLDSISQEEKNRVLNKWINTKSIPENNHFLSQVEKNYLKERKVIKMCNNPNWEPIEFAQNGNLNRMSGIAIDTIKLLEKKLDIKFQNVATKSWGESQQFLKEKKCDILPCAIETSKRKKYANFTKPYLNLPLAIFTTKDKKVVSGLDEIMDNPWTRQKGSGLITKLKKEYPNMKIIETKGDKEALQYVNSGKAYFTIATLPVASHVISKFMLNDLHIAGYTGMVYNLSMAVRDDDKILLNILDKTLENISKEESKQIMRKWVSSAVKEPIADYSLIWKILIIVFIIILFFLYRQYILNKSNKKLQKIVKHKTKDLKKLNEDLEIKIKKEVEKNLNIQKKLFKSEKMAAMGEMIGNIAHQWRQPLSVISTGSTGIQMQKELGILSDEFLKETCDAINNNAQYLSKTIDDFKNFIKGDRESSSFNLANNIDSFLHLVEGSVKNDNLNIKLDLQDDITIKGYPNELIQCFINIFNNAKDVLKEIDEDDRFIFISSFTQNDRVIIQFKDSGGGIPSEILSKIFDPYFTTKHQSQGTGLGLHMTYNLIEDGMDGTIEASNIEFKHDGKNYTGAIFEISLPLNESKN